MITCNTFFPNSRYLFYSRSSLVFVTRNMILSLCIFLFPSKKWIFITNILKPLILLDRALRLIIEKGFVWKFCFWIKTKKVHGIWYVICLAEKIILTESATANANFLSLYRFSRLEGYVWFIYIQSRLILQTSHLRKISCVFKVAYTSGPIFEKKYEAVHHIFFIYK